MRAVLTRSGLLFLLFSLGALLGVLTTSTCSSDDIVACREDERRGVFRFNSDEACGCTRQVCDGSDRCINGQCCDPTKGTCGSCLQTCAPGLVCSQGGCCDPRSTGTNDNCGCNGACEGIKSTCQKRAGEEVFSCQCNFKLGDSTTKQDGNCGCLPTPLRCQMGSHCDVQVYQAPTDMPNNPRDLGTADLIGYLPDPLTPGRFYQPFCNCSAAENLENDANCGCNDACPVGARCNNGVCGCLSADDVPCVVGKNQDGGTQYRCTPRATCDCNPANPPTWALRSNQNCGCNGPCQPGTSCVGGTCVCDPQKNLGNNADCGCQRSKAGDGGVASAGVCNATNGEVCQQGLCQCTFTDNPQKHCGCKGDPPCTPSLVPNPNFDGGLQEFQATCRGGECACDQRVNAFNPNNCGCDQPCTGSKPRCFAGVCGCDPAENKVTGGSFPTETKVNAECQRYFGRKMIGDDRVTGVLFRGTDTVQPGLNAYCHPNDRVCVRWCVDDRDCGANSATPHCDKTYPYSRCVP